MNKLIICMNMGMDRITLYGMDRRNYSGIKLIKFKIEVISKIKFFKFIIIHFGN